MELDDSILEDFLGEVADALESMECDLLELEKKEGDTQELINNVFRLFHSIKGSSSFMGLTNINKITHSAEDLLSLMRTGKILPEPRFIDLLLQVVDIIQGMLDNVAQSNDVDISEMLSLLEDSIGEDASAKKAGAQGGSMSLNDLLKVFPDFDISMLKTGKWLKKNDSLYVLKYELDEKAQSLLPLIRKIQNSGKVITGKIHFPSGNQKSKLIKGTISYDVLLATELVPGTMERNLGLDKKRIFKLVNHVE